MAAATWFVIGPSALCSVLGRLHGPDPTVPTPAEDWREAMVDVVIHAHGDQHRIAHCLSSLLLQTRPPRRLLLFDDGGNAAGDHTAQIAREFANANALQLDIARGTWSLGKAALIRRQARESDGDVLFVLDADAVLVSPDYIERCVRELYQGVGIASVCGVVEPLWPAQRAALVATPGFQRWLAGDPYRDPQVATGRLARAWRWLGNSYAQCVAQVEQGFIQPGLMARYGGIGRPFGSAVAYRRRYLIDLFDRYEPIRGDDLSEVEDLFIGPALCTEGYRNVQLAGVLARVHGAALQQLPRQAYRWSVSFLQGCHYFDPLLRTPLRRRPSALQRVGTAGRRTEQRVIAEAYRQPFGERLTQLHGRPIGTALLLAALERIGYPALLVGLLVLGWWTALALLVLTEVLLALAVLVALAPVGRRLPALWGGVLATPPRYALILAELYTVGHFAVQLWLTGERRWYARRNPPGARRPWRRRPPRRRTPRAAP